MLFDGLSCCHKVHCRVHLLWVGMRSNAAGSSSRSDVERDELCSAHRLWCRFIAALASSGLSILLAIFVISIMQTDVNRGSHKVINEQLCTEIQPKRTLCQQLISTILQLFGHVYNEIRWLKKHQTPIGIELKV